MIVSEKYALPFSLFAWVLSVVPRYNNRLLPRRATLSRHLGEERLRAIHGVKSGRKMSMD